MNAVRVQHSCTHMVNVYHLVWPANCIHISDMAPWAAPVTSPLPLPRKRMKNMNELASQLNIIADNYGAGRLALQ